MNSDDPKVQELLSVLAKIEQEMAQKKDYNKEQNRILKELREQARAKRLEIQRNG